MVQESLPSSFRNKHELVLQWEYLQRPIVNRTDICYDGVYWVPSKSEVDAAKSYI